MANQELSALEKRVAVLQFALEASLYGVMVTAQSGQILYHNQSLLNLFNLADSAFLAVESDWMQPIARWMKDPDRWLNFAGQMVALSVGETLDIFERVDGRWIECRTHFQVVNEQSCRLWTFLDCTEQQRREQELQRLGMHDTLTGIFNRAFFDMKLRQFRLADVYPICMFMIDVDGLKQVNDHQGHPAGDQLLRQAACILRQACRADDIVARLGGDEFGLLLVRADAEVAEQVATRIQGLLNLHNMRHPESLISLSIGFSVARRASEMESLFARADDTMYESRRIRRAGRDVSASV